MLPLIYAAAFIALEFAPDKWGNPPPFIARTIFTCLVALCFAGAGWILLGYFRHQVIADETGIRWRNTWEKWHFAPWQDVNDFYNTYQSPYSRRSHLTSPAFVTSQGTVNLPNTCPSEIKESFQKIVLTKATAARVDSWGMLGIRRVDAFPQTFRYWHSRFAITAVVLLGIQIAVYTFAVIGSVHFLHGLIDQIGWQETKSTFWAIVAGFGFSLCIPLLYAWAFLLVWTRRGESFTVTPEDLRYENGTTGLSLTIPWSEVADYYYESSKKGYSSRYALVLKGTDERVLHWDAHLKESLRLLAIVQAYAPRPAYQENAANGWRSKGAHEKTGGSDPSTWKGGAVGIGDRVFRYRSTESMMVLCFFLICILAITYAAFIQNAQSTPSNPWTTLLISSLFVLPVLWGLACCGFSRVETNDVGITKYTPFGKKHLYWYTVVDYRENFSVITVEGKNGVRLSSWGTINSYKELKAEIEQYAPTPRKGWEDKPDKKDSERTV